MANNRRKNKLDKPQNGDYQTASQAIAKDFTAGTEPQHLSLHGALQHGYSGIWRNVVYARDGSCESPQHFGERILRKPPLFPKACLEQGDAERGGASIALCICAGNAIGAHSYQA